MRTAPIGSIQIIDRQRKEIGPKKLEELKRSILHKGLMHPIVVSFDSLTADMQVEGGCRLRAGERRLRAISALHEEGHEIRHDGQIIPQDEIPYVEATELDEADLQELELEENLLRENLTWLEEASARSAIADLREKQNPNITLKEIGQEIADKKGTNPVSEVTMIKRARLIVENKDNPLVKKSKTEAEAYKALLDESERNFKARLVLAEKNLESPHEVIHGDCRESFNKIKPGSISTIICDPPYGIEADKQGKESKHFYDDSAEYALEICKFIIKEGFSKCTPRAILFMFCDIDHFVTLKTYAAQMAWSVYRVPLIWNKCQGGRAPWGKAGFQRSYEVLLFAVKGQDELVTAGGPDVLSFKPATSKDRTHAAQKPIELLEHLIRLSTLPGETILDPCAGSGSIISAATRAKVRAVCIERDENYYSQAVARLADPEGLHPDEDVASDESVSEGVKSLLNDL
jgi:DNA modification methylase/ParB-like chromosome segregation protein Spo0J